MASRTSMSSGTSPPPGTCRVMVYTAAAAHSVELGSRGLCELASGISRAGPPGLVRVEVTATAGDEERGTSNRPNTPSAVDLTAVPPAVARVSDGGYTATPTELCTAAGSVRIPTDVLSVTTTTASSANTTRRTPATVSVYTRSACAAGRSTSERVDPSGALNSTKGVVPAATPRSTVAPPSMVEFAARIELGTTEQPPSLRATSAWMSAVSVRNRTVSWPSAAHVSSCAVAQAMAPPLPHCPRGTPTGQTNQAPGGTVTPSEWTDGTCTAGAVPLLVGCSSKRTSVFGAKVASRW
mmetsp:Transcript_4304/g.10956  ORF Transcript_4304/g.10956 Transcript_4304/m.10956 type:complete len:296 (+) Transcript_4304:495-1382(+)